MGHVGGGGHCEIQYHNCRVPAENLLGPLHGGFTISQARLGPGRIHHCMRAIGAAERAFEIMCRHANERESFGSKLGEKQFVQEWIATSRMEIDQARLLTQYAAWKMDEAGKKEARQELSMVKVVVPNMMMTVPSVVAVGIMVIFVGSVVFMPPIAMPPAFSAIRPGSTGKQKDEYCRQRTYF